MAAFFLKSSNFFVFIYWGWGYHSTHEEVREQQYMGSSVIGWSGSTITHWAISMTLQLFS